MLPPGISFNALSPEGARGQQDGEAAASAFWAWDEIVEMNKSGYWPYTPNTNLLYGLAEALDMLLASRGSTAVFARHQRWAEGVRAAVQRLGPADPVRRSGRVFAGAHRRDHAGRRRRRRGAPA